MKLCMPDSACVGISVQDSQSGRNTRYQGRIVDVTNPMHERALREQGAFPANLGGQTSGGYRCDSCGFGSFFTSCGRCGGQCTKEQTHGQLDDASYEHAKVRGRQAAGLEHSTRSSRGSSG